MYNFQKLYISLLSANLANLIVSAAGIGVDRWYGYGFSTRQVSSRNTTEEQYHNNFVHPVTSGYNQLGDAYLAAFIEALS